MTSNATTLTGTVYLVGAGPGDPGLLTLRAVECLGRADVVLYDYLVNPATLQHAAPGAELVPLGRHGRGRTLTPEQIVERVIEEARRGRSVARLKGGDPSVFGRGSDETEALRAAGVPYEIVPGVTTGLAMAAYCEIPITQHDDASAVALVAGHERNEKDSSCLDYEGLAAFPGTLVFYMGVGRAAEWSEALIEHGKPADTPVAIVRWCTRAKQQTVRCTLATVADVIARRGLRPPAVFVVGSVVERAPERSWFASRPLFGTRVLVPGSPAASKKLVRRLVDLGVEVISSPAVRVTAPPLWAGADAALDALPDYDWVVFSGANGAHGFLRRLFDRGLDGRSLRGVKLVALGSGAADALARHHLHADLVPNVFDPQALVRMLVHAEHAERILLVRPSPAAGPLGEALSAAGATVTTVVAHRSLPVLEPDPEVLATLEAGDIDWITVTSGAMARSLVHLYGDALGDARIASIGPVASRALRELGLEPAVEAGPHSTDGLVDAILSEGAAVPRTRAISVRESRPNATGVRQPQAVP